MLCKLAGFQALIVVHLDLHLSVIANSNQLSTVPTIFPIYLFGICQKIKAFLSGCCGDGLLSLLPAST